MTHAAEATGQPPIPTVPEFENFRAATETLCDHLSKETALQVKNAARVASNTLVGLLGLCGGARKECLDAFRSNLLSCTEAMPQSDDPVLEGCRTKVQEALQLVEAYHSQGVAGVNAVINRRHAETCAE